MRWIGIIRILVILFTLLSTWFFAENFLSSRWEASSLRKLFEKEVKDDKTQNKIHKKCGNDKECPQNYFAFKVTSGAANVVGPSLCLEDKISCSYTLPFVPIVCSQEGGRYKEVTVGSGYTGLMSSVKNNIGRGINMALVNASTGKLLKTGHYDMYSGDVKNVHKFLEPIKEGTLIFVASFDDPATKLDDKARDMFTSFGSSYAKKLGFRDSWAFVGGKGLKNKSPFEQHLKNDKENNKYDGWPEVLEISGCIPRKMD